MPSIKIVDAFPQFRDFWARAQALPMAAQMDAWAADYMAAWPELRQMQLDDYKSQGDDWREYAAAHVFTFLAERLPAIETAYAHLVDLCAPTYTAAQQQLQFESDVVFVIYVGIGCGAGWVTRYEDRPAILFGLENIAECGWTTRETLHGLLAHEIGHLVHFHWREEADVPLADGDWWQLYTEGFAQSCEAHLTGRPRWHMGLGDDWLTWCQANRTRLARAFLETIAKGESTRPFFGSWYDIEGRRQTGYYLGWEVVRRLEESMGLKEIAVLTDWATPVRRELGALANA